MMGVVGGKKAWGKRKGTTGLKGKVVWCGASSVCFERAPDNQRRRAKHEHQQLHSFKRDVPDMLNANLFSFSDHSFP
jgi:hypothetical protein